MPLVIGVTGSVATGKSLGSKVFGKPEEMQKLYRAIGDIGAAVKGVIDEWRQTLPRDAVAVMEAVNHVEAGYGNWCDRTWLVKCEAETARGRLMQRNGFSLDEASQRLASQRPWRER